MLLITVGGWVVWVAFFLLSHFGPRAAPPAFRPAIRWICAGAMLIYASFTLGVLTNQYGWTRFHRTTGAVGLALLIAGLTCIGVGLFKARRRSHADRQKVNASA
jgi:hypothetical protein